MLGVFRKYIIGFLAGASVMFTGATIVIMGPSDMWRWAIYSEVSNTEKVERAFQNKGSFLKLKSELNEQIVTLNAKIEEQKSIIEKNKEVISNAQPLKQESKNLKQKILTLEAKLAKVENQNKTLNKQVKNNYIYQQEMLEEDRGSGVIEIISDESDSNKAKQGPVILIGETALSEGKPKIMLNGKASITATYTNYSYCTIKIFSLSKKSENRQFRIDALSPTSFILNNHEYIMHYIDSDHSTCKIEIFNI